ncbi:unnamed protein product [Lupinus luteus]|uniref:Uncharacterized protein n=1 Tax=Lupinus luteus TaxID=3873 RepID=A0AAV1Y565_LUPLU
MKVRTLSPEVMVHVLVMGLQQGLFRIKLAKYTDLTMEDLRSKAQQFINLEETHNIHTHTEPRTHHPHGRPKDQDPWTTPMPSFHTPKKSKYSTYTPLNASRLIILQEILSTHLVQLPRPRPDKPGVQDQSKYCDYHSMFGHLTNDCTQLCDTIEDLIQADHLQRFIAGLEQRRRSLQHRRQESSRRRSPLSFSNGVLPTGIRRTSIVQTTGGRGAQLILTLFQEALPQEAPQGSPIRDKSAPPLQQATYAPSKRPRGVHMVELDVRADEGDFRPQPEGGKQLCKRALPQNRWSISATPFRQNRS